MSDGITTAAIKKALRVRFAPPEWACFFEVAQGTGANAGRSADVVAMNLFPSRGLRVHGIEVKASRDDWRRELRDPTKAEPIMRFCDHWWIAAKKGIVLDGELPPTWGLLELSGSALRQKVAAPRLIAEPMERGFIAAMFRRAAERASADLNDACNERLESERIRMGQSVERQVQDRTRRHEGLAAAVAEFETASGIKIREYGDMRGIGEAVKLLHDLGVANTFAGVRSIADQARRFVDQADALLPPKAKRREAA